MLMPTPLFPGRGCRRRSVDILRRRDFEDLREVPDEYTPDELRDAHNEVVRRLVPRSLLRALMTAVVLAPVLLCAGVRVETSRLGSLSNKSNVVTSVTFDGEDINTNAVREIVDSSFAGGTNAVNLVSATVGSMSNSWNRAGSDATNYVDAATNALRLCDGAARPLPKYLHLYNADDSYPEAAQEYYRSRGNGKVDGGCSSVRDGGYLYRNFDYPFDDRAEFVVKMSAGKGRFASVGVAQVGANLTEAIVTSGKPEYSARYKWLPGATVDGVNEHGVACNINVVDGEPHWEGGASPALHPLAAVRWILDNATNAQSAAEYIAAHIAFPQGWKQNFHYMICDAEKTYIVENGTATDGDEYHEPDEPVAMTNFQLSKFPWDGMGMERFGLLLGGVNITNAWYTRAYRPDTNPPWLSEFGGDTNALALATNYWARALKESHRGESFGGTNWWQSVHTSIYDLTNYVLRVAVQETDDWYVFQVPSSGGVKVETDPTVPAWAKAAEPPQTMTTNAVRTLADLSFVGGTNAVNLAVTGTVVVATNDIAALKAQKLDGPTVAPTNIAEYAGKAADAQLTGVALTNRYTRAETDAKLAGKADVEMISEANETFKMAVVGSMNSTGISSDAISIGGPISGMSVSDMNGDLREGINAKANRAVSGVADEIASLDEDGNPTRSGIAKTNVATKTGMAATYLPLTGGTLTGYLYGYGASLGGGSLYLGNGMIYPYADPRSASGPPMIGYSGNGFILYHFDNIPDNPTWHYGQSPSADNEIAVKGDIPDKYLKLNDWYQIVDQDGVTVYDSSILSYVEFGDEEPYVNNKLDWLNTHKAEVSMISATNAVFSNAVLAVGISTNVLATVQEIQSLGTNTVHQIADFVSAFDGIGITLPQSGLTLAGLLAALVAAVTWLKRTLGKVADNSGKPTDDFATDLLGKRVAKEAIDAMTPYAQIAASASSINRSVKVYTATDTMPSPIPLPQIPTTGIIDLEVWIEAGSTAPSNVTFSPGIIPKDGKALEFAANSTNIIHLTARGGATHYTAVAAAFKAQS